MNYKEFVCAMETAMKKRMGKEASVYQYDTVKNNGTRRCGLVFRKSEETMAPTIYLEEFYTQYQEGMSEEELADSIYNIYQQVRVKELYPYKDVLDYQKIKNKIVYKLVHKEMNTDFLKEVPFKEFKDLVILPYVLFENEEFGIATLQIKNEHLNSWKVEAEEVFSMAKKNTPQLLPMELFQLTEDMYVMTNSAKNLGAAVILYPDSLEYAYKKLEEDFFVLPSSIHEVILVPQSFGAKIRHLQSIVKEINESEVRPEEILANSVYYYAGNEKRLIKC